MPPPLFPGAEGLGFRRLAIIVVACVFAVWAGVTMADSPYLVIAGFFGLLYVGTLAVNAKALAWLVIALQPAALIVPFFPGRPFWWELCALLAWPSLLVHFMVSRGKFSELKFDRLERGALVALVGYVGVLVVIMLTRGVGFRAFGGEQMGGRVYVQQIVLSILPVLLIVAGCSRKQLWVAVLTGWILSLTYLVAEFSFSSGGGVMQTILYFLELPTDGVNFESGFNMTGLRRFGSLASVATAGLSCVWCLATLRDLLGRYIWIGLPAMAGFFALGLGSGYRNMLFLPLLTLFFLSVIQRFWSWGRFFTITAVLACVFFAVYEFAGQLPLSVQRAVSILPGIHVSQVAMDNAATTNTDRFEVMMMAIKDIPRYALVGRGFGMERFDQVPLDAFSAGVQLLYAQGMFYNGVLGTLLKTGIFGLVFTVGFVWSVTRVAFRLISNVRRKSESASLDCFDRLCYFVCAQWFAFVVFFYLSNGDVNFWMQYFGLSAALIFACRRMQEQPEESMTPQNQP